MTDTKHGNITTTCIVPNYGSIIMEKDNILSRWNEIQFGCLYNDDISHMLEIFIEVESPITLREVDHTLRGLPIKKVTGTRRYYYVCSRRRTMGSRDHKIILYEGQPKRFPKWTKIAPEQYGLMPDKGTIMS